VDSKQKVSIVIPTYNRGYLILDTILSAIKQDYKNFEIIVMDNCSNDNTKEIIENINSSKIIFYQNTRNIGPVANWKKAVEKATGDYVKILWSDDLLDKSFLRLAMDNFSSDVGFVYSDIYELNSKKRKEVKYAGKEGKNSSIKFIEGIVKGSNYPFSPGCAVFRKKDILLALSEVIENKVGYDSYKTAIGNDLLIYLITASKYNYFFKINQPLSIFRAHKNSISINAPSGKLLFFYRLAISKFLEKYYAKDKLLKINNAYIKYLFLRFGEKFNFKKVSDFYLTNKFYKLSFIDLINILLKKFFSR